jgi:mRNA interferase HigB
MVAWRMRIIARRTLRKFVEALAGQQDQPAVKTALDAWFDEVRKARWRNTADVKRSYATASIVTADRIVFNVKGNAYRLVVAIDFDKGIVWIKWIGTHTDYDQIDVTEVDYEKRVEAHSERDRLRGGARRGRTSMGREKRNPGR